MTRAASAQKPLRPGVDRGGTAGCYALTLLEPLNDRAHCVAEEARRNKLCIQK